MARTSHAPFATDIQFSGTPVCGYRDARIAEVRLAARASAARSRGRRPRPLACSPTIGPPQCAGRFKVAWSWTTLTRRCLPEIRRRLERARDDPNVTNADGSNYWGPYVTRAIDQREADGPALVRYIKDVLRKSGESQGWNSLLEGQRLDLSFEDMVANAVEPIRGLFDDEDREIAARSIGGQQTELARRREAVEAEEVERDRRNRC